MPNGGWIRSINEILMRLCDDIFGHGNWFWAQYGTWFLIEGFLSVAQIYRQIRNLDNLVPISNNSYYQGNDFS